MEYNCISLGMQSDKVHVCKHWVGRTLLSPSLLGRNTAINRASLLRSHHDKVWRATRLGRIHVLVLPARSTKEVDTSIKRAYSPERIN